MILCGAAPCRASPHFYCKGVLLYENRFDHCRQRFQRRCRHPGRHQDHDCQRRVCITALTAQNTTGVTDIFETTPRFLAEQLDAIFTDIYPDAVKIGMVSSAELIDTIAEKLHAYEAKHIVVDPVMVATSGSKLLRDDAVQALTAKLLPMAPLPPIWPKAAIWTPRWSGPRPTFPAACPPCWIWATAPAPWIICLL